MNYLITEDQKDRLNNSIIQWFENNLTPFHGWDDKRRLKKIVQSEGEVFFFLTDSEGDGEDVHLWYSTCKNPNVDNLLLKGKCPLVTIPTEKMNSLMGYFGDLWIPLFKKWFENHTGLPVKSVDIIHYHII